MLAKLKRKIWLERTKAFILLGMGVYLIVLILTGRISHYINTNLQWLTITGAILFLMMGLWQVWQMRRGGDEDTVSVVYPNYPGYQQTNVSWGMVFVTMIPLLFGTLVPSEPLGANAVTGGVSLQPIGIGEAASFSKAPLDRHILDWLREFGAVNNPSALNGQPVDVIGFVYREPFMDEDSFMVARFTISCCVADAFAIGIPVIYEGAEAFETGVWVRIQGTLQAGEFGGDFVPIIRPTRVDETEQPERPYLYS